MHNFLLLWCHQVKRRFREFLNLQDRLNEKPVLRRLTRNVRAPSRMFPMPIGNMDKDYIEKRRKFLQAYLREVKILILVCRYYKQSLIASIHLSRMF